MSATYRIMMWSEWFAGLYGRAARRSALRLPADVPQRRRRGRRRRDASPSRAARSSCARGFSARGFWDDVAASRRDDLSIYRRALPVPSLPRPSRRRPRRRHALRLAVGNGLRADVWRAFEHAVRDPAHRGILRGDGGARSRSSISRASPARSAASRASWRIARRWRSSPSTSSARRRCATRPASAAAAAPTKSARRSASSRLTRKSSPRVSKATPMRPPTRASCCAMSSLRAMSGSVPAT